MLTGAKPKDQEHSSHDDTSDHKLGLAVIAGVAAISLRAEKIIQNNTSFVYILIGVLNLAIGILDIYFLVHATEIKPVWWLTGLLPLGLGMGVLGDVFKRK